MKDMIHSPRVSLTAVLCSGVLACLSLSMAMASTITITTTNDMGAGSLRQGIISATAGDTIAFAVSGVITLTNGELHIDKNLTLAGPGATNLTISGNLQSRVFNIASNVTASISGLTIANGHAPDGIDGTPSTRGDDGASGGGIYNSGSLTLTECVISSNRSGDGGDGNGNSSSPGAGLGYGYGGSGGAIFNDGALTVTGCTIEKNRAGEGGKILAGYYWRFSGYEGGHGGGIYSQGPLLLTRCTISQNRSGNGATDVPTGYGASGGSGGGIYCGGTLKLVACTVSGNAAGLGGSGPSGGGWGGEGGGVWARASTITACTIVSNTAGAGGSGGGTSGQSGIIGGIRVELGPEGQTVFTSIIAGNKDGEGLPSDLSANRYTSLGHNLIGAMDPSFPFGANGDLIGYLIAPLDPKLGPLSDYGGPTPTHCLLAGSPALDAGDDTILAAPYGLTTDQRGNPRKVGAHADIGSTEVSVFTGLATSVTTTNATLLGSVNPNGLPTSLYFRWGPSTNYQNTIVLPEVTGSGWTNLSCQVTGLVAYTIFHFRLFASNSASTEFGTDASFITAGPTERVVYSQADGGPGSLRDAIINAIPGGQILIPILGTIILTNGELVITKDLAIMGPGATNLTISGNLQSRIFNIHTGVTACISGITIVDGHAPDGTMEASGNGADGGGIYNAGNLKLSECVISGNRSGDGAGYGFGNGGAGGGILNLGTLTLTDCIVSKNRAGEGTPSSSDIIYFPYPNHRGGLGGGICNSGLATLTRCTIHSNASGNGRRNSTATGASADGGSGGGIFNYGNLVIIACTVSSNAAGTGGQGPDNIFSNVGGDGAAGGDGGGLYSFQGGITITASTVFGNSAGAGGLGGLGLGGIPGHQFPGPKGYDGKGGAIFVSTNATTVPVVINSIIAGNRDGAALPVDLSGPFTSLGHNLVGATNGSSGFGANGDLTGNSTTSPLTAKLGPLANNGGQTLTHALLPGSPALDAGDNAILLAPFSITSDQRGYLRKYGDHVDIGAFEVGPPLVSGINRNGTGFEIRFMDTLGGSNIIQRSPDLLNWMNMGTVFVPSAGGQGTFLDPTPPTGKSFYRTVKP